MVIDDSPRKRKGCLLWASTWDRKDRGLLNWCWRLDIKVITLFAFSTENFNRTEHEVDDLMRLFHDKLRRYRNDPVIERENKNQGHRPKRKAI